MSGHQYSQIGYARNGQVGARIWDGSEMILKPSFPGPNYDEKFPEPGRTLPLNNKCLKPKPKSLPCLPFTPPLGLALLGHLSQPSVSHRLCISGQGCWGRGCLCTVTECSLFLEFVQSRIGRWGSLCDSKASIACFKCQWPILNLTLPISVHYHSALPGHNSISGLKGKIVFGISD